MRRTAPLILSAFVAFAGCNVVDSGTGTSPDSDAECSDCEDMSTADSGLDMGGAGDVGTEEMGEETDTCVGDACASSPEFVELQISPASATIDMGEEVDFQATALDADGNAVPDVTISWSVDDTEVLEIDQRGVARGLKGGTATVRADAMQIEATAAVTVELVFQSVACGLESTCALDVSGVPWCWGRNDTGQLGHGQDSGPADVDMPDGVRFESLAAGFRHGCGLTAAGELYCWGSNSDGQKGYGALDDPASPTPERAVATNTLESVSAGDLYTCGIDTDAGAVCWGSRTYCQLGQMPCDETSVAAVLVDNGSLLTTVDAGNDHACGLLPDGGARCWGRNEEGQLGNDNQLMQEPPVDVETNETFRAIVAGDSHTCALTGMDEAFCWGSNADGQLGRDQVGGVERKPGPVKGGPSDGGLGFVEIVAGVSHTCAIRDGGVVDCWGNNDGGRLAIGSNATSVGIPSRVALSSVTASDICAGDNHTCVVTDAGEVMCWGGNGQGQVEPSNPADVIDSPTMVGFQSTL